jgi:hypothetical protein
LEDHDDYDRGDYGGGDYDGGGDFGNWQYYFALLSCYSCLFLSVQAVTVAFFRYFPPGCSPITL